MGHVNLRRVVNIQAFSEKAQKPSKIDALGVPTARLMRFCCRMAAAYKFRSIFSQQGKGWTFWMEPLRDGARCRVRTCDFLRESVMRKCLFIKNL
jgi:hypothetical protein